MAPSEKDEGTETPDADDEPNEADDEPADGPLSDLRGDVEKRQANATEFDADEDLFREERVAEVESEAVWADLLMAEGGSDAEGVLEPTAGSGDALEQPGQIVSKTLCHRCEYFGEPPELRCTHEGTTIHEMVDMDHYRVSKCPMVGGERGIGETVEERES